MSLTFWTFTPRLPKCAYPVTNMEHPLSWYREDMTSRAMTKGLGSTVRAAEVETDERRADALHAARCTSASAYHGL